MQPNSYYGFGMTPAQQSQTFPQAQPQPGAKPEKKHNALVPVVILLLLICLGLGGYILVDKVLLKKSPTVIIEESSIDITEPINKVELPDGEDRDEELAKALVGRTFVADSAHEQTLQFNSNVEFTYGYYKDPSADYRKVLPSIYHEKYTLKNNVITLKSGDYFTITNDYLVKSGDAYSQNENTVYFDALQIKNVYTGINEAFNTYINTQIKAKKGSIAADRTTIDFGNFICKVGNSRLTNADNYACSVDYTIYATKDAADKIIADSQKPVEPTPDDQKKTDTKEEKQAVVYENFLSYCEANLDAAEFSKGGTCNEDYSIRAHANIIVRITDNGYRITGLYR